MDHRFNLLVISGRQTENSEFIVDGAPLCIAPTIAGNLI